MVMSSLPSSRRADASMGNEPSERFNPGVGVRTGASGQSYVLQIQALGVPEVRLGNMPLHFPTKKTLALLVYLAVTGSPQPREDLAALLWPDREEERARATLRSTLRLLRQTLATASATGSSQRRDATDEQSDPSKHNDTDGGRHRTHEFVRSGHDRLGRDALWLEPSAAATSARYPSQNIDDPANAHNVSVDPQRVDLTIDLDLDVLEQGVREVGRYHPTPASVGDSGDRGRQLEALSRAVGVSRGVFLAGFHLDDSDLFTDWVEQQRAYWQRRMDRVFDALSGLQMEQGTFPAALETAARWVELNALEEAGYRRLMEAQAATGDRTAALATFTRCQTTLVRALGVEPGPETVALAEHIRRKTMPTERRQRSDPSSQPQRTHSVAPAARPVGPHMHAIGDPGLVALPLAGREAEFAALVAAFERARQRSTVVKVLEGVAGIGKTRLATEFLRWAAQSRGAEVVRGQAFEAGGRLPYQPIVDALRRRLERERAPDDLLDDVWLVELSRLLPELRERYPDLPAPSGEDNVAAERLFEAVAQLGLALVRERPERGDSLPLILFLDDVQWSDVGTWDLVRFVVRRWREASAPTMVLLTIRSEDLTTHGDLRTWLHHLSREVGETASSSITLGALEPATLRRLLEELASEHSEDANTQAGGDDELDVRPLTASTTETDLHPLAQLTQWLYDETGGQPLYIVQMLRTLLEQGVLAWVEPDEAQPITTRTNRPTRRMWQLRMHASSQDVVHLGRMLPASMRAVIEQRLERLGISTRQFLMAGAVLGTRFRPEQAWSVSDLDETSGLDALDEAERTFVVQVEQGGAASGGGEICQFTHDKLREVIYTETGAVRRRVLHRRAFELLERQGANVMPAELAQHAILAGLLEPALRYSIAAGDAALAVYAVRDAIRFYEQARRVLAEEMDQPSSHLPERSAGFRERLYDQLGRAYEWVGAWDEARGVYQALRLDAHERGEHTFEAITLLRMALTAWHAFDMEKAQAWAREALTCLDATTDITLQAEAEWTVGQVETIAGEVVKAVPHARRAVVLARAAQAPELIARSLARLAMTHVLSGQWDDAVIVASEAHQCYVALAAQEQARSGATSVTAMSSTMTQETAAGWAFGGSLPATIASHQAMEANTLSLRAFGEICRGDVHAGVETGRAAHQLARNHGSAYAELYSGFILGVGLVDVGAFEEGLLVARQGLDAARANGDLRLKLHTLASVAYALHALYQIKEAWSVLTEAKALAEQVGIRMWWSTRPLSYRCANRALAGDWEEAAKAALQATALREELQARLVYFDFARHNETLALLWAGEVKRARADMEHLAKRLRSERQDRRYQLVLLRMRAALAQFEDRPANARADLEQALRLSEEMNLPGEEWQLLAELARLCAMMGDMQAAESAQAKAESIVAALAARITDPMLHVEYVRATSHALRAYSS